MSAVSRYAEAVKLYDVRWEPSENGSPVETKGNEATAFANRFSIGSSTWAAGLSMGLKGECELQLRTCDYAGQQRCDIDGKEYEVEDVNNTGEFTRLLLRRRLGNNE